MNPVTDGTSFRFQVNAVGASGYNETITSSAFRAAHGEDDTNYFNYETDSDQAQGTGFQALVQYIGSGGDECANGVLHLFNPASTTYVKNFYSRSISYWDNSKAGELYIGGYVNITAAIDEVQFAMGSGNFDGKIKMYGISS